MCIDYKSFVIVVDIRLIPNWDGIFVYVYVYACGV